MYTTRIVVSHPRPLEAPISSSGIRDNTPSKYSVRYVKSLRPDANLRFSLDASKAVLFFECP